jgi:tagaturonate reductase
MAKQLSTNILTQIDAKLVAVPDVSLLTLPEKVLQFGTGVLLRGLIDQYIHAANVHGDYAGRVVVVKSTDMPGADWFNQQDGLFTEYVRGIEHGERTERFTINAAISRVLNAGTNWLDILVVAASPDLSIVVSNTTEAGLVYDATDLLQTGKAPKTFPGKLLACLYHRWSILGKAAPGLVILPTELVTQNGMLLQKMVADLAHVNQLPLDFMQWLTTANDFCNTLVDRIVPGKLSDTELLALEQELGYADALLLVREPFGLWAIETNRATTHQQLGFARTPGNNIIVQGDITIFRELKLRLLNGTHSFTCALALLLGCTTVKQAMEHPAFFAFLHQLMQEDIGQCLIANGIEATAIDQFILAVQDRFRNPFIEHQWVSISMNYTEKMRMRNIPLIQAAVKQRGFVPDTMVVGFAAFLLLNMLAVPDAHEGLVSNCQEKPFVLKDQYAVHLSLREAETTAMYLQRVLSDEQLWQTNLLLIDGFADQLQHTLSAMQEKGIAVLLEQYSTKVLS